MFAAPFDGHELGSNSLNPPELDGFCGNFSADLGDWAMVEKGGLGYLEVWWLLSGCTSSFTKIGKCAPCQTLWHEIDSYFEKRDFF